MKTPLSRWIRIRWKPGSHTFRFSVLAFCCLPSLSARADTDWVLVLDRSQSMTQNDPHNYRFDAQQIMVDLLAQGVEETHRLSIIRFSGTAEVVLEREAIRPGNVEAIKKTISDDPPEGDTDIGAALQLARKVAKPEGRPAEVHVILLSDGVQAGKIPDLGPRLEAEKKAYQEAGLRVHTIRLNDFSISREEREERRRKRLYYDDRQLRLGEGRLRDIARQTAGQSVQVLPNRSIEDILLGLISPHMSFYRERISGRLQTWPTDRQLFLLVDRRSRDMKVRIGARELNLSLVRKHTVSGDYEATVNPYRNRTVVVIRPSKNVRWPDSVEFFPGKSGNAIVGNVFVISNVRLTATPGLRAGDPKARGGKTRIRENELYPIRFGISIADGITPERDRSIREALKKSVVRIELRDHEDRLLEEKKLPATDVLTGSGNRLYFVRTYSPRGEAKVQEAFSEVVRASIEYGSVSSPKEGRPLVRAPEQTFVITPSAFSWVVRKNWKGEPESSSRPAGQRDVEIELGQEFRLEVVYAGTDALERAEMLANFSRIGASAAVRLPLRDGGGVPRTFFSQWIFPPEPGEYAAKVTIKADGVQEMGYRLRVVRDDFRQPDSVFSEDGTDSATGRDLGSHFTGETVRFDRTRTIHRLSAYDTSKYWASESAVPLKAHLLRKDPSGGRWTTLRRVSLSFDPPSLGTAEIAVTYHGQVADLEPGEYLLAWPEKGPPGPDPEADQRADHFWVVERAYTVSFEQENGDPLPVEGGKPTVLAGTPLVLKVALTQKFAEKFQGGVEGTLTWARKDVGDPMVIAGKRGRDGSYSLSFPTTDFHTGPAILQLSAGWEAGDRMRMIEEDFEIFARTKVLGIAIEPTDDDILIGQRGAAISFKLRAIGGNNAQEQRDLLSIWQLQPANATVGKSERIFRVPLEWDGDSLVGKLLYTGVPEGTYKLVVSSPIARLGQDIAACFFTVRAAPFNVTLVTSSYGTEEHVVLGGGIERAACDGEGAVWVAIESTGGEPMDAGKIVAAELKLNGKRTDAQWETVSGKFRSQPLPLEDFDERSTLALSYSDDVGRAFDISLGQLEVQAVPLKYELVWTEEPPAELGRGAFRRVQGVLHIRGGLRHQREEIRTALLAAKSPFVVGNPASVVRDFEILPEPDGGGQVLPAMFAPRVAFAATFAAASEHPEQEAFVVEVNPDLALPAGANASPIETRSIVMGPSPYRFAGGRFDAQGTLVPLAGLSLTAREQILLRIEDQREGVGVDASGKAADASYRIQIFPADESGESKAIATTSSPDFYWSARREGRYRIVAEVSSESEAGWSAQEILDVLPALNMVWAEDLAMGAIKLDAGQRLPLKLRVQGPVDLDQDSFNEWFVTRAEVLGEGGQPLQVDFTWETRSAAAPGTVAISAVSTKALSKSATKVRVILEHRFSTHESGSPIAVLDLDLVRGGGSLVQISNFEQGPDGYALNDLAPGFRLPRKSRIRLGYRVGSSLDLGDSLKHGVAAIVVAEDGTEKVLDVESAVQNLVIFTPYEATDFGNYTLRLEIRGKTPLKRDFEFAVVKGRADWRIVTAIALAGLLALALLSLLGTRGVAYARDRAKLKDRVEARREKTTAELLAEPSTSLQGAVRINVANRSLGPFELNGQPSPAEVENWVDRHFSTATVIFSDPKKNEKRRELIDRALAEARTELLFEAEKRLPTRGIEIYITEIKERGATRFDAEVVHDCTAHPEGRKPLLSLKLVGEGKLRSSTASGRSVTMGVKEDFSYNGWIGKSGNQIRVSVKVPGVADYSTLIFDLK